MVEYYVNTVTVKKMHVGFTCVQIIKTTHNTFWGASRVNEFVSQNLIEYTTYTFNIFNTVLFY